ncbi:MAG: PKD domain-containing protein, partial [Bacteroidia bacterium]|nr:PKD domain-containing protein [Bacteroidia bacterium]
AAEDNTVVSVSGQSPLILNAGEYRDLTLSQPTLFSADKPIMAAQFSRSACTDAANQIPCANSSDNLYADPFMLLLSPMEQSAIRRAIVHSFVIPNIARRFLNIGVKASNASLVRLDGQPLVGFEAVAGTPYAYAQAEVSEGNHVVESDSGFVVYVYGFGERDSYGYSGDAALNNFKVSVLGPEFVCTGEPAFFEARFAGSDPVQWEWDFGGGATAFGSEVSRVFNQPGTYYIKVRLTTNDGCGADSAVRPVVVLNPSLQIVALDSAGCGGLANGSIGVRGVGGPAPFKFSLNGGPPIQDDDGFRTFTGLGAGAHQIRFEDAAGCEGALDFFMPERVQINVLITGLQNATCHGDANGRFAVQASGPSPPFVYSLNDGPFVSQNVFANLTAGTYTLRVRDANGCTLTRLVTIGQPAAPLELVVSNPTQPRCHGQNTGSFVANAVGGTAPYSLFVNGVARPLGTIASLPAGVYALLLRDANGCFVRDTATIVQPPALSATAQTFAVRCTGANDGRIEVEAQGGVAPYSFALDDTSAFGIDPVFENLGVGAYQIYVRDANGCQVSLIATLDSVAAFSVAVESVVPASCFNVSDGALSLRVSDGGTPPFEYSRDGTTFQSSPVLSGLPPGRGTAVVRDATGCLVYLSFDIPSPPPLRFVSWAVKHPSCPNASDGFIIPTAEGGTGAIRTTVNGQSYLYGLPEGTHVVRIEDETGCAIDTFVVLTAPAPLTLSLVANDVRCFGQNNGSIDAQASGGTPPYAFSLDGSEYQSQGHFLNLTPGLYVVYVRDANGCTTSVETRIAEPRALRAFSHTIAPVKCHGGSDASVEITALDGTPPYRYSHGENFDENPLRDGLSAGIWTFTVRDANGCEYIWQDTLAQPPRIEFLNFSVFDASCFGYADGGIVFDAVGGTGNLSFSLNGSPFSDTRRYNSLPAGQYATIVRDSLGCLRDTTVVVGQPAPLTPEVQVRPVSCSGLSDGTIVASAMGTGPFSYRLNGGDFRSSGWFSSLAAGQYVLTIRSGDGCLQDTTLTVPEPEVLRLVPAEKKDVECKGLPQGRAKVQILGGTPPYRLRWSHRPWEEVEAMDLYAGEYRVVVADANDCRDTLTISITEPEFAVEAGEHLFACYLAGETS